MPRPNQPRSIASERSLAMRVAYERESRGMTYDGLALRMTKAGCPINGSAIYKLEKLDRRDEDGAPVRPRRITVDELVALSEVFSIPVDQLLLPPDLAARAEITELVLAWDHARLESRPAIAKERAAWAALIAYVDQHPDAGPMLEPVISAWVTENYPEEQRRVALGTQMHKLTGDREWLDYALEGRENEADPGVIIRDSEGNFFLSIQASASDEGGGHVQHQEA